MTQQPERTVVGVMQAMMALISPSSRFFNKSFFINAAWISLWDLRAWRILIKSKLMKCHRLQCLEMIPHVYWFSVVQISPTKPWWCERYISQLEQLRAEGNTVCSYFWLLSQFEWKILSVAGSRVKDSEMIVVLFAFRLSSPWEEQAVGKKNTIRHNHCFRYRLMLWKWLNVLFFTGTDCTGAWGGRSVAVQFLLQSPNEFILCVQLQL